MSTITDPRISSRLARILQKQGALIALVALVVFGTLRYGESFALGFNVQSVLADDAKYARQSAEYDPAASSVRLKPVVR